MRSNKSLVDLPECMSASDVAGYLGIAKAKAYALCHSEGFPRLLLGGKRIIVPKNAFEAWLEKNTVTTSREG